VSQSVKRPTLDYSSGHDLRDVRCSAGRSAWDFSPAPAPAHAALPLSAPAMFFLKRKKKRLSTEFRNCATLGRIDDS